MSELYENQLKCSNEKIHVLHNSPLPTPECLSLKEYAREVVQILSKESKKENYFYQEVTTAPVIHTARSGATDLTFRYLDMKKFFKFKR